MKWAERDGHLYAAPYRIYRNTQGYEVWIYGKEYGLLQRGFKTSTAAREFAEKHADRSVPKPEVDQP